MKRVGTTPIPHKLHAPKGKNFGILLGVAFIPQRNWPTKKGVREETGCWRLSPRINRTPQRAISLKETGPRRKWSAKKGNGQLSLTQHRPVHPEGLAKRSEASYVLFRKIVILLNTLILTTLKLSRMHYLRPTKAAARHAVLANRSSNRCKPSEGSKNHWYRRNIHEGYRSLQQFKNGHYYPEEEM